jgi:hypothetical protein
MKKMKKFASLVGILCIFILLSACIAEDYDAGPPEVRLSTNEDVFSLKKANVEWKTEEKKYETKVEDDLSLGKKQKTIELNANQKVTAVFQDNKENGGEFSKENLKVSLWSGEKELEIESTDEYVFITPDTPGKYIIELNFSTSNGRSQYVGNIVVK